MAAGARDLNVSVRPKVASGGTHHGIDVVMFDRVVVEVGDGARGEEQVVVIGRAAGKEAQAPDDVRNLEAQIRESKSVISVTHLTIKKTLNEFLDSEKASNAKAVIADLKNGYKSEVESLETENANLKAQVLEGQKMESAH